MCVCVWERERMRVREIESFLAPNQQSPSKSQPVSVVVPCRRRRGCGVGLITHARVLSSSPSSSSLSLLLHLLLPKLSSIPLHSLVTPYHSLLSLFFNLAWKNYVNGVLYLLSTFGFVSDNSVCWCLSFKQPLSIKIVLSTLLVILSLCCTKFCLISYLISVIYKMEPNLQHWCTVIKWY